jgi:cell division protein ZapA (FtsZ GTPase activity inhibitor)
MTRAEKLKILEEQLSVALEEAGPQTIAAIAKQYRETLKEIEEIEGANNDDEIADILSAREAAGKPGAVRQSRS